MLSVKIVCVGKLKESWWREACKEYEKRLGAFCKFSVVELPESRLPENLSQAQIQNALQEEGKAILHASQNSYRVALCIEGKLISSPDLAEWMHKISIQGISTISFLIGSSFGLSDSVKQAADGSLSMSKMTFPHQLARVMLCEQIYRGFQIQNHGKYHK